MGPLLVPLKTPASPLIPPASPLPADETQIVLDFAIYLIEDLDFVFGGSCPNGSTPEPNYLSLCVEIFTDSNDVENYFVFGSFPIELVALCLQKGGGLMCYKTRWQGDFYLFIQDLFEAGERRRDEGDAREGSLPPPPVHCDSDGDGLFNCPGKILESPDNSLPNTA